MLSADDQRKLDYLCEMGRVSRRVGIHYQKYGGEQSRRIVEPHQLQRNGDALMVVCWQFDPDIGGSDGWRNFRVDRVLSVGDGGSHFTPRCTLNLDVQTARQFSMDYVPGGSCLEMNVYYEFVGAAMADRKFTADERVRAEELAARLSPAQVRAVHAQTMRDVLQECLMDGEISDTEADYLESVRRFLKRVGWAP